MYTINRFGAITLPTALTDYTLTPLPAQLVFVQTTTGAFDNDGSGRNRQTLPAPISYKATVTEDIYANNRTVLDALRAAVGTRALLYRTADNDATVHHCTARLVNMTHDRPYSLRQNIFQIELTFQQLSPWAGALHGAGWTFDSGVVLDNARTLDETAPTVINTYGKIIFVTNSGNIPVTDIQFTLTAGSAPVTNARLLVYGVWDFNWEGSLATGQTLVFDSGAYSVQVNGTNGYSGFLLGPLHQIERMAQFDPGENAITVALTGGSTNSTLAVVFSDAWA